MGLRGIFFSAVLLLAACNSNVGKQTQNGNAGNRKKPASGDTFATLTADVFTPYCKMCHEGAKGKSGVDITDLHLLIHDGKIVPKNSASSPVYTLIHDKMMPPGKHEKVPADLVQRVKEWIDEGAPEV